MNSNESNTRRPWHQRIPVPVWIVVILLLAIVAVYASQAFAGWASYKVPKAGDTTASAVAHVDLRTFAEKELS